MKKIKTETRKQTIKMVIEAKRKGSDAMTDKKKIGGNRKKMELLKEKA